MATVETRNITKTFTHEQAAVDGIDLFIPEGEFIVFLGPSGCGKTTLLRMIAGLEPPTAGDVLIDGRRVTDLAPRDRNIAMVFQSYALYPHMTVFDNIAFPLRARKFAKAEIPAKVQWAADMFGIARFLERKPRELSGGERQRVALARALVREPQVFLLDEPLSNLDAKLRTLARDELQQFQRRIGTTTIYVTHDQVEAMGLGDRVVVLNQGKVRQVGKPIEVYDEPADTFVAGFLGSPPMNLIERGPVILGFRPEHFLPIEARETGSDAVRFTFLVTRVEYLGADRLVYGMLEGGEGAAKVLARLPSTVPLPVQLGERHEFVIGRRDLKFFDRQTGLRTAAIPL
jgi:multiple sugar transport system ATP-binding protein